MTTSPISCKALLFAAVALLTGLFTGKSHAQWVEATGTAQIRNGNKTEAKHNAVQNAIKDALLFAGASVSSVQQVTDGLLTQDHFKVTSHGNIEQMELVDEVHRGQFISVTIRADIIAEFEDNQCEASPFKKSLAITQMSLVNREQAKIGGLYNIGEAFSKRLFKLMREQQDTVLPRPWYVQKLNNRTLFGQYYNDDLQVIDTIANSAQSQFVLLGQISDLSFGEQTSSDYAFWQSRRTERYFVLDYVLYDTSTREMIYRDQLEVIGEWSKKDRQMNVNSNRFWRSDYGMALNNGIEQVKATLDQALYCQPFKGKIMHVNNNTIQFNLGKLHGVEKGQQFAIIHQSHFVNQDGKLLPRFVISPNQVSVTDVYERTAVAHSIDDELLGNIQTTDYVIFKAVEEPELE